VRRRGGRLTDRTSGDLLPPLPLPLPLLPLADAVADGDLGLLALSPGHYIYLML
jgi:hypothetical protein